MRKTLLAYKPILTSKGRNEVDSTQYGFDGNVHYFLKLCSKKLSIAEILTRMYFSFEEISKCILFCTRENLIESPKNNFVIIIANYLSGKYRTGEYFVANNDITENQLTKILSIQKNNSSKKIGEIIQELKLISSSQISKVLSEKTNANKRYIDELIEIK